MAPTTSEHEQIRNTIATVTEIIDLHDWPRLTEGYTKDCVVEYPEPIEFNTNTGIEAIAEGLRKTIGHLETLHHLTTQRIHLTGDTTAEAVTYCMAEHYLDGKSLRVQGRYLDSLVKIETGSGELEWRIKHRKIVLMGELTGEYSLITMGWK